MEVEINLTWVELGYCNLQVLRFIKTFAESWRFKCKGPFVFFWNCWTKFDARYFIWIFLPNKKKPFKVKLWNVTSIRGFIPTSNMPFAGEHYQMGDFLCLTYFFCCFLHGRFTPAEINIPQDLFLIVTFLFEAIDAVFWSLWWIKNFLKGGNPKMGRSYLCLLK